MYSERPVHFLHVVSDCVPKHQVKFDVLGHILKQHEGNEQGVLTIYIYTVYIQSIKWGTPLILHLNISLVMMSN